MNSVNDQCIKTHGGSQSRRHRWVSKRINLIKMRNEYIENSTGITSCMYLPRDTGADAKMLEKIIMALRHLIYQNIEVCISLIRLNPSSYTKRRAKCKKKSEGLRILRDIRCETFNKLELSAFYKSFHLLLHFHALGVKPTTEVRSIYTKEQRKTSANKAIHFPAACKKLDRFYVHLGPHESPTGTLCERVHHFIQDSFHVVIMVTLPTQPETRSEGIPIC